MSVDVLREVFKHSRSKGVARNVITVLADAAHPDGVTWITIDPPKDKRKDQTRCLIHRANASREAVIESVQKLRELGELEVRKAQRGRGKFNIYRVVVGSIAATEVDYSDLPFTLDQPFGLSGDSPPSQGGSETADQVESAQRLGALSVADEVQFSKPRPDENLASGLDAPPSPGPQAAAEAKEEDQRLSDPAAAEPALDAEVRAIVERLPGADLNSPKRIVELAHGLPRKAFLDAVATVEKRAASNPCGLLTHLLQIARAERAAAISAQLAASLGGGRAYVPAPWAIDSLKRDDPERYTRLVAKTLEPDLIREALAGQRDVEDFVELARQIRAGAEPGDKLGTPAEERARWVERHAGNPDADHVIDAWDDVDDVERQELHELAEQIRNAPGEAAEAA